MKAYLLMIARNLHLDERRRRSEVSLPEDLETNAFARARRQLRGFPWLLQLAMPFSALAFARIVSDTSWDVSPRNFIIMASIAAALCTAFLVPLWRMRARILIVSDRKTPNRRGA